MSDNEAQSQKQSAGWSRKRWVVVGSAGIAAVVVAAVLAIVIPRLMAPAVVTAGKLDSLLLDVAQINTIMGASGMQLGEHELAPGTAKTALSKPECLGALTAAQAPTYAGSGYTDLRWSGAREMGDQKIEHYAAQSAAIFPDADKANAFVTHSADKWKGCAEQTVVVMQADKSAAVWKLGTVAGDPPSIAISETRQDVAWTCQRAMRAVLNVVVDTAACGSDIGDQGSAIADAIAANIPK